MFEYIKAILKSSPFVVMSWGANQFQALPENKGMRFNVNGFKFRGWVRVEYVAGSDTFSVILEKEGEAKVQGGELERYDDVYLDTLVDTIDEAVEKTADYEKRVEQEYFAGK